MYFYTQDDDESRKYFFNPVNNVCEFFEVIIFVEKTETPQALDSSNKEQLTIY